MDSQSSVVLVLDEDLEECDGDEEETFTTKQLFWFAWQIAKGMVIIPVTLFLPTISLNSSENGIFFFLFNTHV